MEFILLEDNESPYSTGTNPTVFLMPDAWNDWWEYKTLFGVYFSYSNKTEWIGSIKIGQKGLMKGDTSVRPEIPKRFTELERNFFSLGQDVTYYNKLNEIGADFRYQILRRLNDIALDEELFEEIKDDYITYRSIMRSVSRTSVKGQYRRLANGDAKLTKYYFSFSPPDNEIQSSFEIEVTPNSMPPSNLHILIGRNGVGKTHLINNLIKVLITKKTEYGMLLSNVDDNLTEELFANIVSVSFSSFDSGKDIEYDNTKQNLKYYKIGMVKEEKIVIDGQERKEKRPKSILDLQKEFSDSLLSIINSAKIKRWVKAVRTLESDPIFQGLGIEYLIQSNNKDKIKPLFERLSSGHKIVLLTITRLVETVEERSLVILDEPETHLHPPLLAAFTRALSDLLIYRNAVSVIATHSPVIVQEVPQNCVWIMNRTNKLISFDRPNIETFGENIGTLTREIFNLEVENAGYHLLLKKAIEEFDSYEEVVEYFNGKLGFEARTLLRTLLLQKGGKSQ